ncbi:MAG: alpha/beta fold hydrolase [Ketobacteraceae bacterium]|nr:alpha/beta fold hydrolase [Ketobacteraceae bacterium]
MVDFFKPRGEFETAPSSAPKAVVLIHGLGRSAFAMRGLAAELSRCGYRVINLDYPSTRLPAEKLVNSFVAPAMEAAAESEVVDVVTHSLGGILLRYYMVNRITETVARRLHRVVMLAPPNQGSTLPDHLKRWAPARWVLGPVMPQLGTDDQSLPLRLAQQENGRYPCDIGVIAGNRSWEPWFSRWLDGPNDGKVSVASTRLSGMTDFVTVDAGHTFIMKDPAVHRQVLSFLGSGKFRHGQRQVHTNTESDEGNS